MSDLSSRTAMTDIQLNILYFRSKDPAPSKYVRVLEPLGHLTRRGHRTTSIESLAAPDETIHWDRIEQALKECNILLISNVDIVPETMDLFKRMVAWCNQHRKLIIYDLDDLYDQVPESNPFRKITLTWDFVKEIVSMAHVLTVTGKDLQQALSPHHPRIFIVPNMVDCQEYKPRPRGKGAVRVGWAGGITHLADLPIFAEAIRRLQRKYRFELVVFGMFPDLIQFTKNAELIVRYSIHPEELTDPFHQAYVGFVRHMEGIAYQAVPAVGYGQFPRKLSELDLDIGLCPIQDNLFNRCRSGIKFYQYAAVRTATVASDIYPYSDEPILLAENAPRAWEARLETLLGDEAFLKQTTQLQHDYVFRSRNYENNAILWEVLYQELIRNLCR